ncbi:hypothetical protein, partial [Aeromonas dhakensis]
GSLSRYSKSTVRRHRRVSHFEVEFAIYLNYQKVMHIETFNFPMGIIFAFEFFIQKKLNTLLVLI